MKKIFCVGALILSQFAYAGYEAGTDLSRRIANDPVIIHALESLYSLKSGVCQAEYVDNQNGLADLLMEIEQDAEVGHIERFKIGVYCNESDVADPINYEIFGSVEEGTLYLGGIRQVK